MKANHGCHTLVFPRTSVSRTNRSHLCHSNWSRESLRVRLTTHVPTQPCWVPLAMGASSWDSEGIKCINVQSRGWSMVQFQTWAPLMSLSIPCNKYLGNRFCYITTSQILVTAKILFSSSWTWESATDAHREVEELITMLADRS